MERIIFFTNAKQLKIVQVYLETDLGGENEKQVQLDFNFPNDRIINLLSDKITEEQFKETVNSFKGTRSIYYVYHGLPDDKIRIQLEQFCQTNNITLSSIFDMHEKGLSKIYHFIGEFCQPNSELKSVFFDDLKGKFNFNEELEKKLALLHECLHHESAANAKIDWLKQPQKELVEKLIEINDNLHPDYIATLTQLRKDLLGS